MSRRRTQWLTAVAAGALTSAALWLVYPRAARRTAEDVVLVPVDSEALAAVAAERRGREALPVVADARDPMQRRYYLTEDQARKLFDVGGREGRAYDPWTYFHFKTNRDVVIRWEEHPDGQYRARTNSDGLPDDEIDWSTPRDLRVLVAGDSHSHGLCAPEDTYANLLERGLRERWPGSSFDVLNASQGGFSLQQCLGTLEKYVPWDPDVFVLGVFAGNDFHGTLGLAGLLEGVEVPRKPSETRRALEALDDPRFTNALAQCYHSEIGFRWSPKTRRLAVRAAVDVLAQMQAICEAHGIHFVVVQIPAPCWMDWSERPAVFGEIEALAGLDEAGCGATQWIAGRFLARLRRLGIVTIDLEPVFARLPGPPYWRRDHHLDLAGHRATADVLLELLSGWCVEEGRLPPPK